MDRRHFAKTTVALLTVTATAFSMANRLPESAGEQRPASRRQVVLDTETTGLSPKMGHRIIEIGAVELVDGERTGTQLHTYLDPERDIDPAAEKVHGISRGFLIGKPRFEDVSADLLAYLTGAELIIHNARFDLGFLDSELARLGALPIQAHCQKVIDTLALARNFHPKQRNSLDALCARYGISTSNRELHGALLDAELLAQVYLSMTMAHPVK